MVILSFTSCHGQLYGYDLFVRVLRNLYFLSGIDGEGFQKMLPDLNYIFL